MTGPVKETSSTVKKPAVPALSPQQIAESKATKRAKALKEESTFTYAAANKPAQEMKDAEKYIMNATRHKTVKDHDQNLVNGQYVDHIEYTDGSTLEHIADKDKKLVKMDYNAPKNYNRVTYEKHSDPECGDTETFTYKGQQDEWFATETKIDYTGVKDGIPSAVDVNEKRAHNYKVVGGIEINIEKDLTKLDANRDGNFEHEKFTETREESDCDPQRDPRQKIDSKIENTRISKKSLDITTPDAGDTETQPFAKLTNTYHATDKDNAGKVINEEKHNATYLYDNEKGEFKSIGSNSTKTHQSKNGQFQLTTKNPKDKMSIKNSSDLVVTEGDEVVYKGREDHRVYNYFDEVAGTNLKPDKTEVAYSKKGKYTMTTNSTERLVGMEIEKKKHLEVKKGDETVYNGSYGQEVVDYYSKKR